MIFGTPVAGDVQPMMIMTIFEWKAVIRLIFDSDIGFWKWKKHKMIRILLRIHFWGLNCTIVDLKCLEFDNNKEEEEEKEEKEEKEDNNDREEDNNNKEDNDIKE